MKLLILFIFSMLMPKVGVAQSEELSGAQIYTRCYQLLTNSAVPPNDIRLQRVKAGILPGVTACDELLNSVQLGADGRVNNDPLARKIFKTFHEFHMQWFDSHVFDTRVPVGELLGPNSHAIYDEGEPAVFLTKSLFDPGHTYSQTLQGTEAFELIKEPGQTYFNFRGTNVPFIRGALPANNGAAPTMNPQPRLLPVGDPIGVQPIAATNLQQPYLITIQRRPSGRAGENPIQINNNVEIFRSFGGGILGSRSFMLMSMNKNYNYQSDGAILTNRHWAVSLFEGLLCKHLPAVPIVSVPDNMVVANSQVPYRRAKACVQCHASIDQLANVTRNVRYVHATTHSRNGLGNLSIHTYRMPADQPALGAQDAWNTATVDPNFARRPPSGTLFFQSYDGTIINTPATGFENMGAAIAATNDFHVCAAKRYYQHLTGIDVDLSPEFDADGKRSTSEMFHRNLVVQLGTNLKSHGDLRRLVSEIFASETFKSVNFLAEDR